ncbi:MAG: hypothetical protein Q4G34_04835 [Micrococcus sp.]|nr:hypothetical protein [Micrococcus sp.]
MAAFIVRLLALAWRYGRPAVTRAASFVRSNWPAVERYLALNGFAATVEWIMRRIGIIR